MVSNDHLECSCSKEHDAACEAEFIIGPYEWTDCRCSQRTPEEKIAAHEAELAEIDRMFMGDGK